MGGGGQGGWERRIEAFVKIKKKNLFFFWVAGGGGGGGQGGCERRSKVFVIRGGWVGVGSGGGPIRGWSGGGEG